MPGYFKHLNIPDHCGMDHLIFIMTLKMQMYVMMMNGMVVSVTVGGMTGEKDSSLSPKEDLAPVREMLVSLEQFGGTRPPKH